MRHVPFFRWVLTLGVVLFACSVGLDSVRSELPEARQIDLSVVDEKPDGTCRVRWVDPYQKKVREAPYHCDAGRADSLKAPQYFDHRGYGWESGFMITEGPDRGNLEDLTAEPDLGASGVLLLLGVPLIGVGLIGGNLRALPRVMGVRAGLVRRATRLSEAAAWAAEDYERALAAVREAEHRALPSRASGGTPDPRLVTALWALREAGPQARETAALARALADRTHALLHYAAPAAGLRTMLRAGPSARLNAEGALNDLRWLLADAERNGLPERFAQTSVDLLRGQESDQATLAAQADYTRNPDAYHALLAQLTGPEPESRPRATPARRAPQRYGRR
ncbi:hypothetical protein [Streptomyces sp. NPDC048659]|uniref:hypothetical protein n=1 Tax=Streptomyces sp. NPDC048659 TaxID=3155489 RepID=UPI00341AAF80